MVFRLELDWVEQSEESNSRVLLYFVQKFRMLTFMIAGKGGGFDDSALRFTNFALMSIFISSPLSSHNPFSYELSNFK
jgi:hypothetical protein